MKRIIGGAMQYKLMSDEPRTYAVILETGEDVSAELERFAAAHNLSGSSFKAIGALQSVKLGWFDWKTKKYKTAVALREQVELLSLIGDIALKDGRPQVHAHVVVGRSNGRAYGGHLLEGKVRPTCEIILTESPVGMQRQFDPESGIALIRL
jgi:uncharacterized protein